MFTLHSLSESTLTTRRVVLFLVHSTLYACQYTRKQSRYRNPFMRLQLCPAATVVLGKQTPALRLAPSSTPDRRCFAIRSGDGEEMMELEAPGSGDVKYWLRTLWEVLVGGLGMTVGRELLFVQREEVSQAAVERVGHRLRQGRVEGQGARRKEEWDRRLDGLTRLHKEKQREEKEREEEQEQRRKEWEESERRKEERVAQASDSPQRREEEERERLAACRRMQEEKERERQQEQTRRRQAASEPLPLVPPASFALSYAQHNKRSASLQTHTSTPIRFSPATPPKDAAAAAAGKQMQGSKSYPNLASSSAPLPLASPVSAPSVKPLPTPALRSSSGPAAVDLTSPSATVRQLASSLPVSSPASSTSQSVSPVSPSASLTSPLSPLSSASASPSSHSPPSAAPLPPPSHVRALTTPVALPARPVAIPAPSQPQQLASVASHFSSHSASYSSLSSLPLSHSYLQHPYITALPVTNVYQLQHTSIVVPESMLRAATTSKQAAPLPSPSYCSPAQAGRTAAAASASSSSSAVVCSSSSCSPSTAVHIHCNLAVCDAAAPPHIHVHYHSSASDTGGLSQPPPPYSELSSNPNSSLQTFLHTPTSGK